MGVSTLLIDDGRRNCSRMGSSLDPASFGWHWASCRLISDALSLPSTRLESEANAKNRAAIALGSTP